MQGAELTSVMLGWSPYIMFEGECRSEGYKDCPYQGIMADVAQSLEKTFNFTLRMDKDPGMAQQTPYKVIFRMFQKHCTFDRKQLG